MAIQVRDPKVAYRTTDGWVDAFTNVTTPYRFPTATSVGVDAIDGWEPAHVITGDLDIHDEGAIYEDYRIEGGSITLIAPNVTMRRCEFIGGSVINNIFGTICNGALFEDCTTRPTSPGANLTLNSAYGNAGYTCRRCAVVDTNEGWHTGGSDQPLADPSIPDGYAVRLYDCFGQITPPPGCTVDTDYHGDLTQGVDFGNGGVPVIMRNCTLRSVNELPGQCVGNAALFWMDGNCLSYDLDRILMQGCIYPVRLTTTGRATNLLIVDDSWYSGAVAVENWDRVDTDWSYYVIDEIDDDGQPGTVVASIPHGYNFGPFDPPPDPPVTYP